MHTDGRGLGTPPEGPVSRPVSEEGMVMPRRRAAQPLRFRPLVPHGGAVAQRRRVSVALLQQAPHGLTAREIREATGFSTNLTASALTGHGQVNANMTHLYSKEKTRESFGLARAPLFSLCPTPSAFLREKASGSDVHDGQCPPACHLAVRISAMTRCNIPMPPRLGGYAPLWHLVPWTQARLPHAGHQRRRRRCATAHPAPPR